MADEAVDRLKKGERKRQVKDVLFHVIIRAYFWHLLRAVGAGSVVFELFGIFRLQNLNLHAVSSEAIHFGIITLNLLNCVFIYSYRTMSC